MSAYNIANSGLGSHGVRQRSSISRSLLRMIKRGSVFSGVLAVALWATLGTAEAKLVRYEINGQRYSYSTNNRQQVREARQRIQAAQQAAAERAANPLVRLFGSPTHSNATEAQARAQQVPAQPSQAIDLT